MAESCFAFILLVKKYCRLDNIPNREDLELMFCFLREKIKGLFSPKHRENG